jgi:hypothetical protein
MLPAPPSLPQPQGSPVSPPEKQKLEELRRHLEANRWKDFENTIISKIEARISDEIERELQLSRELNDAIRREIDRRWMKRIQIWEGVAQTEAVPMEGITTCDNPPSPMRPMEGITINGTTMPTIKEFSEGFISSGGLDDSRHAPNRAGIGAPNSGRDLQTCRNYGDPPTGPRGWSKTMGRKRGESKKCKSNKKDRST